MGIRPGFDFSLISRLHPQSTLHNRLSAAELLGPHSPGMRAWKNRTSFGGHVVLTRFHARSWNAVSELNSTRSGRQLSHLYGAEHEDDPGKAYLGFTALTIQQKTPGLASISRGDSRRTWENMCCSHSCWATDKEGKD